LNTAPLQPDGGPNVFAAGSLGMLGSVDGEFFDQDRVVVIKGRMADPRRRDEFVASPAAAAVLGVKLGGTVEFGIYTSAKRALRTSARRRCSRRPGSTPGWSG